MQMSRIQGGNEVIKKEAMTKHFTAIEMYLSEF